MTLMNTYIGRSIDVFNRKVRRELSKKLGEDFPLDQLFAITGYYNAIDGWGLNDTIVSLLRSAVSQRYAEIVLSGGFDEVGQNEETEF